jgi:hypothetical protein
MRKRLKTITGAAAALTALALGGSAIASATQGTQSSGVKHSVKPAATKSVESVAGPDTDSVQSGDQTSPDTTAAKASSASAAETPGGESSTETSSESSSESSTASDGPGGHEDPAGNVDYQSEAQE